MLESAISSVVGALRVSGLEAVKAFRRQELCAKEKTLVCVSVKAVKGLPAGFGGYLGLGTDPQTGLPREIYGARCQLEIGLDIYAPMSAENGPCECLRCAGLIAPALRDLPEGLKVSSLSFGQARPDEQTGRFVCPGTLTASACFIAREAREDGLFTDFILRGSVEK